MWKPPERIKHPLPEATWPSADAAAASRLFSPVDLGPVRLAARTWVPAMVPWRATGDGVVTDEVVAWYRRFADGQPGALVVEATGIRDVPSGPLLRIGHDRFTPGLRRIVDAVREASGGRTRLFIQLIDFLTIRRRPDPEKYFRRFLTVTERHRDALGVSADDDVRDALLELHASKDRVRLGVVLTERELEALDHGYRERVSDTHLDAIRDLPAALPTLFADAARRARDAGFDGV
ncbi:MAG: NADH:flavin oxidoreductase, partial [Acidobacteriota bacterium]